MTKSNYLDALAFVKCSGCLVVLPNAGLSAATRYRASGECWSLYGELSAYNFERGDLTFLHQLAVDAYGAQHAGDGSRPITTAFSLIGMALVWEYGYNGRQVQMAHMQLARQKFEWPPFNPPDMTHTLTVADVMQAEAGQERDQRIREWSTSVWTRWTAYHDWVLRFCHKHLKM
jgi:Family of unknown function (DUF5946)